MNLGKKAIIITGGAGKIGSPLAKSLIKKGYRVLLGDINKVLLQKIKKKINSNNLQIFSGDLSKRKVIDNFIKFGIKKFGKIDSAIHLSYPKSKKWGSKFENLIESQLREDLYTQLGGTILFSQRILKYFTKMEKGNLVLMSSIQGVSAPKFEHYKNLNMVSPLEYSAIKSGVISITKYLSKYFKKKNIRINCVSPGGIEDNQPKKFKKRYKETCNSKGLLSGEDVSKLILFLLSDESNYIHGQNLIIDDGWSL
ncbi:MAG: short-chain dehydrogenase [Cytophagia bacterium]|nr:short-chain dehydrogenase [Cytophagia bacterium]